MVVVYVSFLRRNFSILLKVVEATSVIIIIVGVVNVIATNTTSVTSVTVVATMIIIIIACVIINLPPVGGVLSIMIIETYLDISVIVLEVYERWLIYPIDPFSMHNTIRRVLDVNVASLAWLVDLIDWYVMEVTIDAILQAWVYAECTDEGRLRYAVDG